MSSDRTIFKRRMRCGTILLRDDVSGHVDAKQYEEEESITTTMFQATGPFLALSHVNHLCTTTATTIALASAIGCSKINLTMILLTRSIGVLAYWCSSITTRKVIFFQKNIP